MKRKASSIADDHTEKNQNASIIEDQPLRWCRSGTIVVNIRKAHICRENYADLEDWMSPENNEYIGRGRILILHGRRFPTEDSLWANPFKAGRDGSREVVLSKFESYMRKRIQRDNLQDELKALRGKNLGCWCVPRSTRSYGGSSDHMVCHGQVILKILDEIEDN